MKKKLQPTITTAGGHRREGNRKDETNNERVEGRWHHKQKQTWRTK